MRGHIITQFTLRRWHHGRQGTIVYITYVIRCHNGRGAAAASVRLKNVNIASAP